MILERVRPFGWINHERTASTTQRATLAVKDLSSSDFVKLSRSLPPFVEDLVQAQVDHPTGVLHLAGLSLSLRKHRAKRRLP